MFNKKICAAIGAAAFIGLHSTTALSASGTDINDIKSEIVQMKKFYESRIKSLESKLAKLEDNQVKVGQQAAKVKSDLPEVISGGGNSVGDKKASRKVYNNEFNPSMGIILNGKYATRSESFGEIPGFAIGEEGETFDEGFAVDHTEINFSANIDDKFTGSVTAALAEHGGSTEVELEEAYVETLPGFGLVRGLTARFGRSLWDFGYLNSHHAHTDDFADRPLSYRAFLNGAFNDDGAQISYVLPTDFYSEIGAGYFKGNDFPAGGANGSDADTYSAFLRLGGDITDDTSFRLGFSTLQANEVSREGNHGEIVFDGESNLYAIDLKAIATISSDQELILQGEYFWRDEKGDYTIDADTNAPSTGAFDDSQSGWYAQAIYKFDNNWRAGYRYSELNPANVSGVLAGSELDVSGYDPKSHSFMIDWTNSEFSRIRAQYNSDETMKGQKDDQFILQYIMSFGAHAAHKY